MNTTAIRRLGSWLADCVFPVTCFECGADGSSVCSLCCEKIPIRTLNESWESLVYQSYCDRVFIASWFDESIVAYMIKHGKYYGQRGLLQQLGSVLTRFCQEIDLPRQLPYDTVLTHMPLHRRRYLERGFNQSADLAVAIQSYIPFLYNPTIVSRKKYTRYQARQSRTKRQQNVDNAFIVLPGIELPRSVLVVDDVVTTGASLDAVARVLKLAGVKQVFGLVVAKH